MKIGIVGAENSHTAAIAKTINVEKLVEGFTVDYVWGETEEFARKAAEAGSIPNIVGDPAEMLGKVDAVIVDHRHPLHHLPAVWAFVERGVPTFVDKPFCYRAEEGRKFLAAAKRHKAPVTSFSVIPHQQTFKDFKASMAALGEIKAGTMYGPCDLESVYGGVFFYGVHQVEALLEAFGYNVASVLVARNGENATGQLLYADGKLVTMNFVKAGVGGFNISAIGDKGIAHQTLTFDANAYLGGIKTFTDMFRTGVEPRPYEQILKPVQVLEALEKSVASGKVEAVEN